MTNTAREIAADNYSILDAAIFNPYRDAPDVTEGESVDWSNINTADYAHKQISTDAAELFIIRGAGSAPGWEDTDHLAESNMAALLAHCGDEPEAFGVFVIGGRSNGVALAVLADTELPEAFVIDLIGLVDYPVVDEEDFSRREYEAYEEDLTDAIADAAREYADDTDADADAIREAIYDSARDADFHGRDGQASADWDAVAAAYHTARDEYFATLATDAYADYRAPEWACPGQLSL